MTTGARLSNMQCAHTETLSTSHMLYESQSKDLDSGDVVQVPVPEDDLCNNGDKYCHTVRFLGMDVCTATGPLVQQESTKEKMKAALLTWVEMDDDLTQVWLLTQTTTPTLQCLLPRSTGGY